MYDWAPTSDLRVAHERQPAVYPVQGCCLHLFIILQHSQKSLVVRVANHHPLLRGLLLISDDHYHLSLWPNFHHADGV